MRVVLPMCEGIDMEHIVVYNLHLSDQSLRVDRPRLNTTLSGKGLVFSLQHKEGYGEQIRPSRLQWFTHLVSSVGLLPLNTYIVP